MPQPIILIMPALDDALKAEGLGLDKIHYFRPYTQCYRISSLFGYVASWPGETGSTLRQYTGLYTASSSTRMQLNCTIEEQTTTKMTS